MTSFRVGEPHYLDWPDWPTSFIRPLSELRLDQAIDTASHRPIGPSRKM